VVGGFYYLYNMNIVPPSKPKMTKEEVLSLVKSVYSEFAIPDFFILGVRGYYKKTMGDPTKNDRLIYDDAIFLVGKDYFAAFNANTDPSTFKKGVAVLKAGIHKYKKGKHGLSKPSGGYPALRPANFKEELPVTRDGKDSVGVAINIHKGSLNSPSSLGCQTIFKSQWEEFITNTYSQMDLYKMQDVDYVLLEQ